MTHKDDRIREANTYKSTLNEWEGKLSSMDENAKAKYYNAKGKYDEYQTKAKQNGDEDLLERLWGEVKEAFNDLT